MMQRFAPDVNNIHSRIVLLPHSIMDRLSFDYFINILCTVVDTTQSAHEWLSKGRYNTAWSSIVSVNVLAVTSQSMALYITGCVICFAASRKVISSSWGIDFIHGDIHGLFWSRDSVMLVVIDLSNWHQAVG